MINQFIFVHILKCGGTTLRTSLFDKKFKKRYLYDSTFKPKRNKLTENDHPVYVHPQPFPKDYRNFDIIFGHFRYDKYQHLNRPMFSFVRHPVQRMISQYFYHKKFYERKGKDIGIIEFSSIWKNHQSYVLGNINKFEYIGITEDFDASLKLMCQTIGIEPPKRIKKKRVRRKPSLFDKKIRKKIAKMNSDDMELYYKILDIHKRKL